MKQLACSHSVGPCGNDVCLLTDNLAVAPLCLQQLVQSTAPRRPTTSLIVTNLSPSLPGGHAVLACVRANFPERSTPANRTANSIFLFAQCPEINHPLMWPHSLRTIELGFAGRMCVRAVNRFLVFLFRSLLSRWGSRCLFDVF